MGKFCFFAISIVVYSSCSDDLSNTTAYQTREYIHLSHTRTNDNEGPDPDILQMDLDRYPIVMLGGDLMQETSKDLDALNRCDLVFDLTNPNTLWSVGNHDVNNKDLIIDFTNRKTFYTHQFNDICFVVLDTETNGSNIINDQLAFLNNILDTIEHSTHLIILHHKLIWMVEHLELHNFIFSFSNGPLGSCAWCLQPNNFYSQIYPSLVDVRQKDIPVICIAGDIGMNQTEFEYKTQDDIYFLASGIDYLMKEKKALVFEHDLENKTLNWEYLNL